MISEVMAQIIIVTNQTVHLMAAQVTNRITGEDTMETTNTITSPIEMIIDLEDQNMVMDHP